VSKNEKTAIGKKKHKESHQVESRNDDGLDLLCMESGMIERDFMLGTKLDLIINI